MRNSGHSRRTWGGPPLLTRGFIPGRIQSGHPQFRSQQNSSPAGQHPTWHGLVCTLRDSPLSLSNDSAIGGHWLVIHGTSLHCLMLPPGCTELGIVGESQRQQEGLPRPHQGSACGQALLQRVAFLEGSSDNFSFCSGITPWRRSHETVTTLLLPKSHPLTYRLPYLPSAEFLFFIPLP